MPEIPVIDVAPWRDGHNPSAVVDAFQSAYGTLGFGYIRGHGIDRGLIDAVFDAARSFHALPLEAKMELQVDDTHRGYIPIGISTDRTSTLAEVTKPNQSASLMIMREDAAPDPAEYLSGPNRWPDIPGFREVMEQYQAALSTLARDLLVLALRAAEVHNSDILQSFDRPTTWLRLLHYPPRAHDAPGDLFGSAPHTDFGALTILAQDPVGGLEVMTPQNAWVPAPYMPDAFVVNVGDMLHRMTNGRLRSTPHRVINRSGKERFSCPFFFDPNVNTVVAPLPGTGEAKYLPIRFADFLKHELEASYDNHAVRDGGET